MCRAGVSGGRWGTVGSRKRMCQIYVVENGKGRVVDRALMDYVLLPKRMLGRMLDVKVWRGEGGGIYDNFLMEARLKLVGGWRSAGG